MLSGALSWSEEPEQLKVSLTNVRITLNETDEWKALGSRSIRCASVSRRPITVPFARLRESFDHFNKMTKLASVEPFSHRSLSASVRVDQTVGMVIKGPPRYRAVREARRIEPRPFRGCRTEGSHAGNGQLPQIGHLEKKALPLSPFTSQVGKILRCSLELCRPLEAYWQYIGRPLHCGTQCCTESSEGLATLLRSTKLLGADRWGPRMAART